MVVQTLLEYTQIDQFLGFLLVIHEIRLDHVFSVVEYDLLGGQVATYLVRDWCGLVADWGHFLEVRFVVQFGRGFLGLLLLHKHLFCVLSD